MHCSAGGMGLVPLVAGCNLVFGIDELQEGPSVVSTSTQAASTIASSSGASLGGGGMGGVGGASDGGMGGTTPTIKRVFVTSQSTTGNLGGYAGGHVLCQQLGQMLGPSVWRAWLSDDTHDAIDEIADVGPWFLVNGGPQVVADKAQLASGILDHPIDRDENDREPQFTGVWTGTGPDGTVTGGVNHHCDGWTSASSAVGGVFGLSDQVDANWTAARQAGCSNAARLYCFEQ